MKQQTCRAVKQQMKPTATVTEDCTQYRPTSHVVHVPLDHDSSPPLLSSLSFTYRMPVAPPNILQNFLSICHFFISFILLKGNAYLYPFVSCLCPFFCSFLLNILVPYRKKPTVLFGIHSLFKVHILYQH